MKNYLLPAVALAATLSAAGGWARAADAPSIEWQPSWVQTRERARQKRMPMLVYFSATWCGPCRKLEKETLSQRRVVSASRRWVPFKADLDEQDELAARYNIETPPTLLFLSSDGRVIDRLVGYYDASTVAAKMESAFKRRNPKS